MTLDLTQENQKLLRQAATSSHRSESELANEAMHWYFSVVPSPDERSEKLARSRRQIAQGRTIDHEELFAEIFEKLDR